VGSIGGAGRSFIKLLSLPFFADTQLVGRPQDLSNQGNADEVRSCLARLLSTSKASAISCARRISKATDVEAKRAGRFPDLGRCSSRLPNDAAKDGLWKIGDARQVVYAAATLSIRDRIAAASRLADQSSR
jgi:hypothetical protein